MLIGNRPGSRLALRLVAGVDDDLSPASGGAGAACLGRLTLGGSWAAAMLTGRIAVEVRSSGRYSAPTAAAFNSGSEPLVRPPCTVRSRSCELCLFLVVPVMCARCFGQSSSRQGYSSDECAQTGPSMGKQGSNCAPLVEDRAKDSVVRTCSEPGRSTPPRSVSGS